MRIFISWSGARGQHFAAALHDLLLLILPEANPWTSTELRRGSNWTVELLDALREARACLFCVTADGLESTWEYFEAGMLQASDDDPVLTRCICLDVPPQVLAGGPLASIPVLQLKQADIVDFLVQIDTRLPSPVGKAEIEARYVQAREFFEARMSSLPESRARHISVVMPTAKGLCPIEVISTGETQWPVFVATVRDAVAERMSVAVQDRDLERCLDVETATWIEPPVVIAQLKSRRIAFMPPAQAASESAPPAQALSESAFAMAIRVRQILDVTPTHERALAAMRRDLQDLIAAERTYLEQHARYADTGELGFYASPGTSIQVEYTVSGFHAIAKRADVPAELAVRLGDGTGRFQDQPEGTVFMSNFEESRFYALKTRA